MKQTNEQLLEKFKQIKQWMCGDIKSVISTGANYLTALGLLVYTEIIGSFITGNGQSTGENFDAFFGRLGGGYSKLLKKHNKRKKKPHVIYDDLRCGLMHEYLIKRKDFTIYHSRERWEILRSKIDCFRIGDGRIQVTCGVMHIRDQKGNGSWHFISPRYFFDFQNALECYWDEIRNLKNKELRARFFKRARYINFKKFSLQ